MTTTNGHSTGLVGRPSTYTDELGERIATLFAEGNGWKEIAGMPGMPSKSTISAWLDTHDGFRTLFARARRSRAYEAERKAGEILAACDPDAEPRQTSSARVSLANYRASHERWLASCLDRETYGDRPAVQVNIGQVQVAFARLSSPSSTSEDE